MALRGAGRRSAKRAAIYPSVDLEPDIASQTSMVCRSGISAVALGAAAIAKVAPMAEFDRIIPTLHATS